MSEPATELVAALESVVPGCALDLACGKGRHTRWLLERGWHVTAIDIEPVSIEGATTLQLDLETAPDPIAPAAWDLIVCWLYYQPALFPAIRAGLRPGGVVALAGKTTGRFATSLGEMRAAFRDGFTELAAGQSESLAFLIGRYNG